MSLQRNYYEVLGLPPGATTDQIKKKYRELARKFHPDVAQDKNLGQLTFTQINQAYNTLSNPERRAQYNGTLQNLTAPSGPSEPAKAPAAQNAASRPSAPKPATPAPKAAAQPAPSQPAAAARTPAFTEMLNRAENAIMAGKPVEARAFCVRILEADPRHVRALEILGDSLVLMGRQEEAAVQYRQALQIAPSSLIQAKLNRVAPPSQSTRTMPPQAPLIRNGSGGQKTIQPGAGAAEETEKPGGLLGRLLGRK